MSGRKKQSAVWKYYSNDPVIDKSKCNLCNQFISGDNSSNVKTHLRSCHKTEFAEVEKVDGDQFKKPDIANIKASQSVNVAAVDDCRDKQSLIASGTASIN